MTPSRVAIAPVLLTIAACSIGCAGPQHPEIRAVLDGQVDAWNRGDIEGFMQGYWKSDELVFTSRSQSKTQQPTTTRGWQAALDRYRSRYPTTAQMGSLRFENLAVSRQGEDAAQVAGLYRLRNESGEHVGRFFLHMRRINGRWVIVKDHTVAEE